MDDTFFKRNNKAQIVSLPKSVAFPDVVNDVNIIPLGKARLVTPVGNNWENWFDGEGVTEDFMNERE